MKAYWEASPLNDRRMLNNENWFLGGPYGGFRGGNTHKLRQNICLLNTADIKT